MAYLAASGLVLQLHLTTEDSHASLVQVLVCLVVIAGLILGAVALARRPRRVAPRPAARLRTVAAPALVVSMVAGFRAATVAR